MNRLMVHPLGFLAVVSLAAPLCASVASANSFDGEARVAALQPSVATRFIGKLTLPSDGWCTAGLIARDLVLTASHCVINRRTRQLNRGTYTFQPELAGGASRDSVDADYVWWGTADQAAYPGHDWAILHLKQPLGDIYGWMGARNTDPTTLLGQRVVEMTAYSDHFENGNTPSYESGCAFRDRTDYGVLLHDCSMSEGASGAPMYRAETDAAGRTHYYVLAVNSAERHDPKIDTLAGVAYSPDTANIAIPVTTFFPTLIRILKAPSHVAQIPEGDWMSNPEFGVPWPGSSPL